MNDRSALKLLAAQLACPHGEQGLDIANMMNTTNAQITERSITSLAPVTGQSVIEIGCGNGELSKPILAALGREGHFIGIELSQMMASEAYNRLAHHPSGCKVSIHCSSCTNADITTGSVDAILAINVIYFVDDLSVLLTKALSWLRPGGRLVIGIRSPAVLRQMPFSEFGFIHREQQAISEQLLRCGFTDIHSEHHDEGVIDLAGSEVPIDAVIFTASKPLAG